MVTNPFLTSSHLSLSLSLSLSLHILESNMNRRRETTRMVSQRKPMGNLKSCGSDSCRGDERTEWKRDAALLSGSERPRHPV